MNQRKLTLTVAASISTLLLGVTGQTAQAATMQIHHKPFNNMTRGEKVSYLHKQIRHDHSIIRFWKNHLTLQVTYSDTADTQTKWAKQSLRIATRNLHRLAITVRHYSRISGSVPQIICRVFREDCSMAERVAYRESRYSIYAQNGQYLGIFQMGSHERSTYATIGYSTAYEQIVAAHNYYLVSGWSPWSETAY